MTRPLRTPARRTAPALVALTSVVALTAGCGGAARDAGTGVKAKPASQALAGTTITVGSKDFTEQLILGQMTLAVLQANGAKVKDETNIQGSSNTRKALETGRIDLYWDYTGTGWITYLKNTKPIPDEQKQYDAVKTADLQKNGIAWVDPAPLNNTYALAIRSDKAKKLGVTSMTDVAAAQKKDPKLTFCIESEFSTRDDGFPGLQKAYGFTVPRGSVKTLDTGVVYTETGKGACDFGEVFTTDGRISSQKLTVMADDKKFFPVYQAALTLKDSLLKKNPKLGEVLKPMADKLTNDVMLGLNAKVDVEGLEPKAVAQKWLKDNQLLG